MASTESRGGRYTIIVEHLDPELEDWQALEYKSIAGESRSEGWDFILSGLSSASETQQQVGLPATNLTEDNVENLYSSESKRQRVCLLDPKAEQDLNPEDGKHFDVFLFGGILGDDPPRGQASSIGRETTNSQLTRVRQDWRSEKVGLSRPKTRYGANDHRYSCKSN